MQFKKLLEAVQNKVPVQVITLVAEPSGEANLLGQILLYYPDGQIEGQLVNEDITRQVINYLETYAWEKPALFKINAGGDYKFFRDKWVNSNRAIVFGGGHISQPLVEMLGLMDFDVTVVDDRPEFANNARFPRAGRVICESFSRVLAGGGLDKMEIDEQTAVIVVTRGHRYDLDCLRGLSTVRAGYMGMIGSRRRVKGIIELLAAEGVSDDFLQNLRSPIGIDIGATAPAEIALSIAAEVLAVLRSGTLKPLGIACEEVVK